MSSSQTKLKFRKVASTNKRKDAMMVGKSVTEADVVGFEDNVKKYTDLLSWMIFYPDLFLDLMTPERGSIKIHYDQRVF